MKNEQAQSQADGFADPEMPPPTQQCQVYTFAELRTLEMDADVVGPNELLTLLLGVILGGVAKPTALPIAAGSRRSEDNKHCQAISRVLERQRENDPPLIRMGPTVGNLRIGIELTTFAPVAECTQCGERGAAHIQAGLVYLHHHSDCSLLVKSEDNNEKAAS